MGKKHQATFAAILEEPDRSNIAWNDFMDLLVYLGADVKMQSGSATGIKLNGVYAVFHRPHPGNEIYKTDLKRIRKFLFEAGVKEVK